MTLREMIFDDGIKFILAGGKGGVGKTSCAGAIAVLSARHGYRTLVLSTDPAHSLSDSFDQNLAGGEIIEIAGIDKLWGMEINANKGMADFQDVMSSGEAGPEAAMAAQLLGDMGGMSPPGSDEAMAFGKMLEFLEDSSYDRVVFDTAPTGHTLKLLEVPDLLDSWLGKILTLRQRMSSMMAGLRAMMGGGQDDESSWKMLQRTKEKIRAARVELSNPELTQFVVVTIPEAMAVFETQRLLGSLNTYSIPSSNIVVNQLIPENPDCRFCSTRREMQQSNLIDIKDIYSDVSITEVPLFDKEIRGIEGLTRLGHILIGEES
ncbi:MAG: ArsA family ATPase [Candidatus Thorarchaeota archaeon]